MAPKTLKAIRVAELNKLLEAKGLQTWRISRVKEDVAALVIIACNKINPTNPQKAYRDLTEDLKRKKQGRGKVADATLRGDSNLEKNDIDNCGREDRDRSERRPVWGQIDR